MAGKLSVGRRLWAGACFALGVSFVLWICAGMWGGHFEYAAHVLKITANETPKAYGCRTSECAKCLTDIDAHRSGFVFAGGSGGSYGFDLERLAGVLNAPISKCFINDTTFDGLKLILNQKNKLTDRHTVVVALNSWSAFETGGAKNTEPGWHFRGGIDSPSSWRSRVETYLILVSRHFSEQQIRWRLELRTWPQLLTAIDNFPRDQIDAKEKLMQRYIKISPWAASFLPKNFDIPAAETMSERTRQFREVMPTQRIVAFDMPEYTPITQAQRGDTYREAKMRFAAALKAAGIEHIPVDYAACGVTRDDFHLSILRMIDPVHPITDARAKITECVLRSIVPVLGVEVAPSRHILR